jgi:hypothetical protein
VTHGKSAHYRNPETQKAVGHHVLHSVSCALRRIAVGQLPHGNTDGVHKKTRMDELNETPIEPIRSLTDVFE